MNFLLRFIKKTLAVQKKLTFSMLDCRIKNPEKKFLKVSRLYTVTWQRLTSSQLFLRTLVIEN